MRKAVMVSLGVCLTVLITGCSQSTQGSDLNKQTTNSTSNQAQNSNENKLKKDHPKSELDSFSWKKTDRQQTNKDDKTPKNTTPSKKGIVPAHIKIPAINVDTNVIKKGLVKKGPDKGQMATPDNAVETAWYKLGAKPGQKGSSVIAGHVDTTKGPGVFFNLKDLKNGDLIHVKNKSGEKLTFKVYQSKAYMRDNAPVYKVFGYTAAKTLRLATCTGDFDEKADTHMKRLVVSAVLVDKNNQ